VELPAEQRPKLYERLSRPMPSAESRVLLERWENEEQVSLVPHFVIDVQLQVAIDLLSGVRPQ
jgi:hypothetical protein